jgi:NtrC-family two-component system sensor histidine kinase KinB
VLLVGVLDYVSGQELSFSIFYLLPVSLVAWFVGWRAGVLISMTAAVSWFLAGLPSVAGYSSRLIPVWNTLVRLVFFLFVTHILSTLRRSKQRRESLIHFVVHDLRAPLAIILTGLQTLRDLYGETMERDEQTIVGYGIVAGEQMLILINSLLDLARLESGRMPLQVHAVDAQELVESSRRQVALWATQRELVLVAEAQDGARVVRADPELTVRILANLLGNAIKYSPVGATVAIHTAPAENGMLAFRVSDQGPGVPAEWQARIFDKFVQVDAPRGRMPAGSGLGLSFCRLAVEAQGGRIWLDTLDGQGTTIAFTLPAG